MGLAAFFSDIPLPDPHLKQTALSELESSLLKCIFMPDGAAARRAVDSLVSLSRRRHMCFHSVLCRLHRMRALDWEEMCAIRSVKRAILPLVVLIVQRTWRKRVRIRKAAVCIQRAFLNHAYKPGGYVFRRGLSDVLALVG
eukprot:2207831-Prymnesium_polylepis.1